MSWANFENVNCEIDFVSVYLNVEYYWRSDDDLGDVGYENETFFLLHQEHVLPEEFINRNSREVVVKVRSEICSENRESDRERWRDSVVKTGRTTTWRTKNLR